MRWIGPIRRCGAPEFLLLLAGALLALQMIPSASAFLNSIARRLSEKMLEVCDLRQWSSGAWFVANVLFVASLLFVRFGFKLRQYRAAVQSVWRKTSAAGPISDEPDDSEARRRRDREWRERATKRLPFY